MNTTEMTAFEVLAQAKAIEEATNAVQAAIGSPCENDGTLALPADFKVHDLEDRMSHRRRMRGKFNTPSIQHFADYVSRNAEAGATVFVEQSTMTAVAVLNLGRPLDPGHADNVAVISARPTAAGTALRNLMNKARHGGLSQRDLAEFLEDWEPSIECIAEGEILPTKRAIDGVRRITIEAARHVESEEQSLSAERSVMESIAARSKAAPLPEIIRVTCVPYQGLAPRTFDLRLSVRTGDAAKPSLSLGLQIIREEEHWEQMADELCGRLREVVSDEIPVLQGSYERRN